MGTTSAVFCQCDHAFLKHIRVVARVVAELEDRRCITCRRGRKASISRFLARLPTAADNMQFTATTLAKNRFGGQELPTVVLRGVRTSWQDLICGVWGSALRKGFSVFWWGTRS